MPVVLILAFAASFGLHAVMLFGPEVGLGGEPESVVLLAEIRPALPPVSMPSRTESVSAKKSSLQHRKKTAGKPPPSMPAPSEVSEASPEIVPDTQDAASSPGSMADMEGVEPDTSSGPGELAETPISPESRLPPQGMIRYRVDRGDSNFAIGTALHEWAIDGERYRLTSRLETTGLVWLFRALRIDMESRGLLSADGLQPEVFTVLRNGEEAREKALFDWQAMTVRVGDRPAQVVARGTQDLLSFNYQLGFSLPRGMGGVLPIATGRKYGVYRLEVLGDEEIEIPAGIMRTLHLRAPGVNTTELWLAYDYLLLPVKIRHVDSRGESLVQVATEIRVGRDPRDPMRE